MTSDDFFTQHLAAKPVIAIFRGMARERTLELCQRAWDSGVELIEVPAQNEAALDTLAAAVELGRSQGKLVGAGTLLEVRQVEAVVALGAAFGVAPGLDLAVVEAADFLGLPFLPGVATASEVNLAMRQGRCWLKAFPARELGQTWAKAMKGPFPTARFCATGGMSAGNSAAFINSGYDAVAVGSAFEDAAEIVRLMDSLERG